jgi:hypothetical protein
MQIAKRFKQYDLTVNQGVAFEDGVADDDRLINYLRVVYSIQM